MRSQLKTAAPISESVITSRLELSSGLSLVLKSPETGPPHFPTDAVQKGWRLICGDRCLVEEGTGFALPLVRYGYRTYFPASARVSETREGGLTPVSVTYSMALVERLARRGNPNAIRSESFYRMREGLCAAHRNLPFLRESLEHLFDSTRACLHMETRFEAAEPAGTILVTSTLFPEEGRLATSVDITNLRRPGCTGIVIANEQGATYFDVYRDSDGAILPGDSVGTWSETSAKSGSFVDRQDNVTFTLDRRPESHLFRGREVKPGRLAWAGLDYVLPPHTRYFQYDIRIRKG